MTPLDVTVVIGTYGGEEWRDLAVRRAIPSARALGVDIVAVHGESLHQARNDGLSRVRTDRVVFLDADDELEPGYAEAMATVDADVLVPRVRYIRRGVAVPPIMPRVAGHHQHACTADCLAYGNWIVIGACVRTDLVRKVGGFRDFAWSEDWDLWVRIWQAGGTFAAAPEAIYRAHVRRGSRNRAPAYVEKLAAHRAIAEANGLPVP